LPEDAARWQARHNPQIGEQMRSVYDWVLGGGPTPQTVRL